MLTVIVPILINKDIFEPSYSDLKFMVWNHSYFSTNPDIYRIIQYTQKCSGYGFNILF